MFLPPLNTFPIQLFYLIHLPRKLGPVYWYSYKLVNGQTIRTYIGKQLPAGIHIPAGRHQDVRLPSFKEEGSLIRLSVLGSLRVERRVENTHGKDAQWLPIGDDRLAHQPILGVLGALLSTSGRRLHREQLAYGLWPDQANKDPATAMARLDRAVYSLRQIFEPGRQPVATSPLVLTDYGVVALADQSLLWCDADAFTVLVHEGHLAIEQGRQSEAEYLLEQALALYRGHFFADGLKRYMTGDLLSSAYLRRQSLRRQWVGALLDLVDLRIERRAYPLALEILERLLVADPTNEAATQRVMRLLFHLGRRSEAVQAYHRLRAALRQSFNMEPLPKTQEIYKIVCGEVVSAKKHQEVQMLQPSPPVRLGSGEWQRRVSASQFVGREHDLALLTQLLVASEQTAQIKFREKGRALATDPGHLKAEQYVFLLGEPGIGKTRLAEEIAYIAEQRQWTVAWGRGYPQEAFVSYNLWTPILRGLIRNTRWNQRELELRPVAFYPLTTLLPEMDWLPVLVPEPFSPEQEQLRIWEAVGELLKVAAASTRLLIVFDDLHFADLKSCQLLAYLARRWFGSLMIIGTCRKEELPTHHPLALLFADRHQRQGIRLISLPPLSSQSIHALVSSLITVPEPVMQHISKRSGGNPYFAEELARMLSTREHSSLALIASKQESSIELPETITDIFKIRLSSLNPATLEMLTRATIFGNSFTLSLIQALEARRSGASEQMLLEALDEALRVGLLTEEVEGETTTYHFWHPLLASYLIGQLSKARRAYLHRQVADLLCDIYQDREEEGAALITYHLLGGGKDLEHLATWATRAADVAYRCAAYADAERYYKIGLNAREQQADVSRQVHVMALLGCLEMCALKQDKVEEAADWSKQAQAKSQPES